MTETLLLNLLFLLMPVFMFYVFFENKTTFFNRAILVLLSASSMILCMTFPIHLPIGFIYDLRYIPFIIAGLFGGYRVILPLYVLLNFYRFIIAGDGTYLSLIFSTFILAVILLSHHKFIKLTPRNRVIYASGLSLFTLILYLTILGLFYYELTPEFLLLCLSFLLTQVGGVMFIMLLIEQLLKNVKIREKLFDTERLNTINQLSASVAHEIRNPLTVAKGFLQLLQQSPSFSGEEKRYLTFSLDEVKRAEKIVSDFLTLSLPQSENMVHSTLKEEAEQVKEHILPYASFHQVEVKLNFTNTLETTYDRNQMEQCLLNLCKNGVEAMTESGGTLTISIFEQKKNIAVQIEDTGVGMSKDQLKRLGKPYYSTKEKGTGLGMLIVYNTMNKLGGTIEVSSQKGKGTTFLLTIPPNPTG
ncbi:ATP-binding protein [Halalkalibacter oceani]|uniref:ATP-binding protein n=1 Tax=Halalkalibacter oceani TaxID=1653776 RepID=UPI003393DD66